MAHVFIKPTVVVDTAIKLLQREIVLPQLVWLNGIGDFAGKYQDTITIRVPARTVAHRRTLRGVGAARNLVTEDLTENAIPVTLDHDVYHAVALTDEELTLDINDFAGQVLNRQIRAVAEDLENGLAATIEGADYSTNSMSVSATADGMWDAIVDARRKLNDAYIDRNGRVLVVGSAVEAAFLKDDTFHRYDSTGDSPNSALRDATIGQVAGLNVIVSDALLPGDAYLFHPTAFIMATRPPAAPKGASFTSSASAAGLALRWLMDYDYASTTDRSLVDTFVGYQSVVDPVDGFVRAVKIRLTSTGSTVSVDGAGDQTVTAAAGADHTVQLKVLSSWGEDVTNRATWASSDATKATVGNTATSSGPPPVVGNKGLVTGVAAGTTNVTAAFDGQTSANFTITVS
jgi:hypothetical protein